VPGEHIFASLPTPRNSAGTDARLGLGPVVWVKGKASTPFPFAFFFREDKKGKEKNDVLSVHLL